MKCFGCCRTSDVLQAIGLRMSDLFPPGPRPRPSREPLAVYDYRDTGGVLIAQKRRFAPKRFVWRRPAPDDAARWVPNLEGVTVGLYRLPDLVDERRVVLVEGEKAADGLWAEQFPATCPPHGASVWNPAWSADLWRQGCRELIILPDNDPAGRKHAERVAQATWDPAVPNRDRIRIKIVTLPGLSAGADVFDWFAEGGTRENLMKIVSAAPQWAPGATERARAERKRLLARDRQRRHRQQTMRE